MRVAAVRGPLQLNENPLDTSVAALSFGHDVAIARHMQQIAEIGDRAGVRIVFVILPVFETADRSQSKLNKIMDRAIGRLKEGTVELIDHRRVYLGPEYFSNYDHPNDKYFAELLSPEICAKYLSDC